jgi:hypothetical protein
MAGDAEMRALRKNARALVQTKFSAEAIGKDTVALSARAAKVGLPRGSFLSPAGSG